MPLLFDLAAYRVTQSKAASRELFQRLGVPLPAPWPVCGFPAVVKPDVAQRQRRRRRGARRGRARGGPGGACAPRATSLSWRSTWPAPRCPTRSCAPAAGRGPCRSPASSSTRCTTASASWPRWARSAPETRPRRCAPTARRRGSAPCRRARWALRRRLRAPRAGDSACAASWTSRSWSATESRCCSRSTHASPARRRRPCTGRAVSTSSRSCAHRRRGRAAVGGPRPRRACAYQHVRVRDGLAGGRRGARHGQRPAAPARPRVVRRRRGPHGPRARRPCVVCYAHRLRSRRLRGACRGGRAVRELAHGEGLELAPENDASTLVQEART